MRKYVLFILALHIGFTTIAQSLPTTSEYQALMSLYQSTNGPGWTNKTGWSTADPNLVQSVQGWYGITTNATGSVIYLELGGNNLTGTIPSEIGNLGSLVTLYLYNTKLKHL